MFEEENDFSKMQGSCSSDTEFNNLFILFLVLNYGLERSGNAGMLSSLREPAIKSVTVSNYGYCVFFTVWLSFDIYTNLCRGQESKIQEIINDLDLDWVV